MNRIFLLVCLGGFMWGSCVSTGESSDNEGDNTFKANRQKEFVNVKVAEVAYGDFPIEIISNGKVNAPHSSEVRFPLSEMIMAINVKNGDNVIKDQVIATLDRSTLERRLQKSQNELDKSTIELNDRLIDYGLNIKDSATIPANIMKTAKVKSGYASAFYDYIEARVLLSKTYIRAPFSGKIANIEAKPYNHSDGFKKLCDVIDDRNIQVDFSILENEYFFVRPGSIIHIKTYDEKNIFTGRIIQINPLVDENGMIKLTGTIENSDAKLVDGMNVKIIIEKRVSDKLFIPKQAIIQRQNRNVVFIYNDGKAHWQYVETGLENSAFVTVRSGLKKGQKVIVSNVINLANNSEVTLDPIN